jgi:hypothetical protein
MGQDFGIGTTLQSMIQLMADLAALASPSASRSWCWTS